MPTYEYQCRECEDRFERFQKMTDPAVTECPSCGGPVRKMMHPPAIAFKGPGFYVNDYKKSSAPKSESAPVSTAKTETKTETKTESKTSAKPEPVPA